jgi:hypothetical protein
MQQRCNCILHDFRSPVYIRRSTISILYFISILMMFSPCQTFDSLLRTLYTRPSRRSNICLTVSQVCIGITIMIIRTLETCKFAYGSRALCSLHLIWNFMSGFLVRTFLEQFSVTNFQSNEMCLHPTTALYMMGFFEGILSLIVTNYL